MKSAFLPRILSVIALFSAILPLPEIAKASSDNKYHCREIDDTYGVYSRVPRGSIQLLQFTREVSPEWSIDSRCEEVATRFQRYYDSGLLRYIGAGYLNNEPVLCAVLEKGEECSSNNLLVTLPTQSTPHEAARQLMDTRVLAKGVVLDVKGKRGKLESYVDGKIYYDLEVLEQMILEAENSDRLIEND